MRENQIFIGYIQVTLYFLNVFCLILYMYVQILLVSLAALLWTNNQPRV